MRKFRVVFMGTPEFSVPCLAMLHETCEVVGVVTQPDKPRGRGQKLTPSPVKAFAVSKGLPVYQPVKVKEAAFVEQLAALAPELIVVVAFGQILSQRILDIPAYGCINVHASLLPHYRGAAPMQWCVINGERETGVTTMRMDAGLDTGDMLRKRTFPIGEDTTLSEVHDGLMALGADVLRETLEALSDGTLVRVPQTGASNYAPMLDKEIGHIDWRQPAKNPRPRARSRCVARRIYLPRRQEIQNLEDALHRGKSGSNAGDNPCGGSQDRAARSGRRRGARNCRAAGSWKEAHDGSRIPQRPSVSAAGTFRGALREFALF